MRLLLADDHRIVREGLRWMLAGEPDVEIVAEASDGRELLEQLRDGGREVDIVLLDLHMPGMGGLDALAQLEEHVDGRRTPAVVVLSMHAEPSLVRRSIELGVAGYLLKSATRDQLLTALRCVMAGNSYVQPEVTAPILDHLAGRGEANPTPRLTEREREVVTLVADGKANKQIASLLGVTEATVKTHLKEVFTRLGAANRAEAVAKALHYGLVDGAGDRPDPQRS